MTGIGIYANKGSKANEAFYVNSLLGSILRYCVIMVSMLVTILSFQGCSTTTPNIDSQGDYSSANARDSSNLAMPPGLTAPDMNSEYKMLSNNQLQGGYELNNIKDMKIVQSGSERWLVVYHKTVNQMWQLMQAFLNQQGLGIKFQDINIGLIQTNWNSRNTTVKETGVRALFDWVGWGSMYSLQSQYMYRINLWQNESDTYVFVSIYQMNEVYPGCVTNLNQSIKVQPSDAQATKWMPVAANPQLELEFLMQFMAFTGLNPAQVKQTVASNIAASESAASAMAHVEGDSLLINDEFDRAWWRTGIALGRVNLGISDKNRSLGEYYVYPLQSEVDNPEPGFLSKLFGNDSDKLQMPKAKYTVTLKAYGKQTMLIFKPYSTTVDKDFIQQRTSYLEALQKQLR